MNRINPFLIALCVLIGCAPNKHHSINIDYVNTSADPSKDFYLYANGGWLSKTEIPSSERLWSTHTELADKNKENLHTLLTELASADHEAGTNAQKVGDFFRTGMDSAATQQQDISPLKPYLDEIDAIKTVDDVLRTSVDQQKHGGTPLFGIWVSGDLKQSSVNTAYVWQDGLGLPDREYYLDKGVRFVTYRQEYLKHLKTMFTLLGADTRKAESDANTVLMIETRLAKASRTLVQLRDLAALYNKRTLAQASTETPNIHWKVFFTAVGAPNTQTFVLAQPEFFRQVSSMLKEIRVEDWRTYLRWHLLRVAAPSLSPRFADPDFAFFEGTLLGVKEMKPRWKRVAEQIDKGLGEALGQLYVEKYFPPEAKAKANQLVHDIRAAFKQRIEKLDWMSDSTKKKALEKLAKIVQKIGYPDKWRDYSPLEIKRDAYVLNVMRANEFEFNRNINKIGKPVDRSEWGMTPPTVNAYYQPLNNEIVFPAGILQPPFFDPDADDASNYGCIGSVIGHEISHAFDDQGSKFDWDGNMVNWWTGEDRKKFDARAQVVVDQYDAYTVLDTVHVNGKLTLGENIADLGGTAVAYDALQLALARNGHPGKLDGFTPEQRFFIAYANGWKRKLRDDALLNLVKTNPHSPANFRTNGPLSNMDHFFDAFGVKRGDPMRRPDSLIARIW